MGTRNRFRLNLSLIHKLLSNIPPEGTTPSALRDRFPGLGGEKIRGVREWADDLGLTRQDERRIFLTPLGQAVLLTKASSVEIKMQEILYYRLATCKDLEVFRALVNVALFDASRRFEPAFDVEEVKRRILAIEMVTRAAPKYVQSEVSTALNTLTSEDALGKLRIVVPIDRQHYRVNSYLPDWRSAAYILYDSWPENTSRMRISEVVSGQNSLGRIFFLTEPQVMALLVKLEQERAIALEVVADLRQIGLNPAMKAEDFLEMLIHDQH